MIVPVEVEPAPIGETEAEIGALFKQAVVAEVPVFAIHDRWATNQEAMEGLHPHLEANGLEITNRDVRFLHPPASRFRRWLGVSFRPGVSYLGYTGLHADSFVFDDTSLVEVLRIHTTEEGEVDGAFYEPTEEYIARYFARPLLRRWLSTDRSIPLPKPVYRQLRESVVDDEVLVPVKHTVAASVGTTIVFRSLGRRPVFHRFTSTELPRLSRVSAAAVKIATAAQL